MQRIKVVEFVKPVAIAGAANTRAIDTHCIIELDAEGRFFHIKERVKNYRTGKTKAVIVPITSALFYEVLDASEIEKPAEVKVEPAPEPAPPQKNDKIVYKKKNGKIVVDEDPFDGATDEE